MTKHLHNWIDSYVKKDMPGSGQVWNMVSEADAEEKKIDDLNAAIESGGFWFTARRESCFWDVADL